MDTKLIVAFIGLLGIILSAIVQYLIGRQSEKTKKAVEIRTQAYLDLVNSVSEIASTSKKNNKKIETDQLKRLIQSKSRVVLIGSDEVVLAVHKFFTEHEKLLTNESFGAFSNIISTMRHELSGKNNLKMEVLSEALFGKTNEALKALQPSTVSEGSGNS